MCPIHNESGAVINAEGHPAELQLRIQVSTRDRILCYREVIDSGLVDSTDFHSSRPQGHAPEREQKMLKGHLPRVMYHLVY